ncbi:MAG: hypothetical protein AB7O24_03310 [Kofleriaceae bacterium]
MRNQPTRRVILAVAAIGWALLGCKAGTDPAAKPAELASADAVIEASIAAQGGRSAIGNITSIRQTGTIRVVGQNIAGRFSLMASAPRNSIMVVDIERLGTNITAVAGDLAWTKDPKAGYRMASGAERETLRRELTFNADLVWKQLYRSAELEGLAELGGVRAYKVVLTANDGAMQTRYFAKDTLLQIGTETVVATPTGPLALKQLNSEFREVGGVKYAHKLVLHQGPATLEFTIEKLETNVALPPDAFALPAELKSQPPTN